jgi:hypothetical protein
MTQAEHIIEIFGGKAAMAHALGHKHPTTVQGWQKRGFIPAKQQQAVLDLGRSLGLSIGPEDFFPAADSA